MATLFKTYPISLNKIHKECKLLILRLGVEVYICVAMYVTFGSGYHSTK